VAAGNARDGFPDWVRNPFSDLALVFGYSWQPCDGKAASSTGVDTPSSAGRDEKTSGDPIVVVRIETHRQFAAGDEAGVSGGTED